MNKNFTYRTKAIVLASVICCLLISQPLFAQCGNYFKSSKSAIGKIENTSAGNYSLADWTGDGKLDFWNFKLNPSNSTHDIIIFPAKATGYWDWDNPIVYPANIPSSISNFDGVVTDFNFDGHPDIRLTTTSNWRYIRNNGNGTFTVLAQNSNPPSYLSSLGYHDLNNDNILDWVTMTNVPSVGSSIGYQLGNADGTLGQRVSLAANIFLNAQNSGTVGDFNGDGKIDIIYRYIQSSQYIYIYLKNTGNANFVTENARPYEGSTLSQNIDVNSDGRMDIVGEIAGSESQNIPRSVYVLYGQSDGTFIKSSAPAYTQILRSFRRVVELNGDNHLDIIEVGDNFYSTFINNGSGSFTRTDYDRKLVPTLGGLVFSDFTGDNKADFFVSNGNVFGENVITVKENICNVVGETKTQDFKGDRIGDVVYWNPASGRWSSYDGIWGLGNVTTSFYWGSGSLGDVPVIGDFDSDGKSDYSVYRNSTGVWYVFRSSDSSWQTFQFGISDDVPVPADYDGGGKTDYAIFRPSTGVWYVWQNETQQFYAVQFGLSGDKAVPADYDGDGKTDIAVWRPSTGVWYYLKSSENNSFAAIQWGLSTDKPVPADYDGDGKADLTVYRNGVWYFLRSSLNNSFSALSWGTATDIPVPFYKSSDVAQVVVLRPSNGLLYNFSNPNTAIGFDASQNTMVTTTLFK